MNLRLDNGMVKAQGRYDEGTSLMHSGKFRLNAHLSAPYARLSFKHTLHGDILSDLFHYITTVITNTLHFIACSA